MEMLRDLLKPSSLSNKAKKIYRANFSIKQLNLEKHKASSFKIINILNRATSVDWSILDLFYQLNAFTHFKEMYSMAETGEDEGPICNLGLITQYLARYMEEVSAVITGTFLSDDKFVNSFLARLLMHSIDLVNLNMKMLTTHSQKVVCLFLQFTRQKV